MPCQTSDYVSTPIKHMTRVVQLPSALDLGLSGLTINTFAIDDVCYSLGTTVAPTAAPAGTPTVAPTAAPAGTPTVAPTAAPAGTPTVAPTAAPAGTPTVAPTAAPSAGPTAAPSAAPAGTPTTVWIGHREPLLCTASLICTQHGHMGFQLAVQSGSGRSAAVDSEPSPAMHLQSLIAAYHVTAGAIGKPHGSAQPAGHHLPLGLHPAGLREQRRAS